MAAAGDSRHKWHIRSQRLQGTVRAGEAGQGRGARTSSEKGRTRGASEAMLVFSASAAVGTTLRCSMMPRMPSCAQAPPR